MELAHKELLKSLGGESSGGTTPVGNFHTEAARWADTALSPPAKEPLTSDSRSHHELGTCPENGECSSSPLCLLVELATHTGGNVTMFPKVSLPSAELKDLCSELP